MNRKSPAILFVVVLCAMSASARAAMKTEYQTATVVSVESYESSSDYAGSNWSDAPLRAEVYGFDIGIRAGCTVYRTRYESAFNYLPSVFTPSGHVEIKLKKRVLYVSVPGERELRMGIGSRKSIKDESCPTNN
jgi:hypothetical protein